MSAPLTWIETGDGWEAEGTGTWRAIITPLGDLADDRNAVILRPPPYYDTDVDLRPDYVLPLAKAKRWAEIVYGSGACAALAGVLAKLAEEMQ